ncbi:MAG: 2-isopropylmalate synthase [Armatimonadetes bacterium]|nr:2-isopropylmalate synthase [Armatimonadota bacterium]
MSDPFEHPPEEELIYDWNRAGAELEWGPCRCVVDRTLAEGELSPAARRPNREERLQIAEEQNRLSLDASCVGRLPDDDADVAWLMDQWARRALAPVPTLLIPPRPETVSRAADLKARGVLLHLPVSRLRRAALAEDPLPGALSCVDEARACGLDVTVVCQDAARAYPSDLATAVHALAVQGATAVCLSDDSGHATAEGTQRLVRMGREILRRGAPGTRLDWHGHNDRGLALSNALVALREGAEGVHAAAFGLGEGSGCAPLDLLLANLKLLGGLERPLRRLQSYCATVARCLGIKVLPNYPILGEDAFRTGTGVHAAAIIKAEKKGHAWLADRIYSGIPAGLFGFRQIIEVGPMAGASNVQYWLRGHGLEATQERVDRILQEAKRSNRVLTDPEIQAVLERP